MKELRNAIVCASVVSVICLCFQIIEKSRLLAQVASSLITKEKKLEAVKSRLRTLKSTSAGRDSGSQPAKNASDSQALLIDMDEHCAEDSDQDQYDNAYIRDEANHSVRLDVEECGQSGQRYHPLEEWAVSSLSEQDIQDISEKGLQYPSPHHRISLQARACAHTL